MRRCAPILLLFTACAPSEEELRALGEGRLGGKARTIPIGWSLPASSAEECCCPPEAPWYDFASRPETCDVYEGVGEGERHFRGTTYVDPACLVAAGLLQETAVRRRTVDCRAVACPGQERPDPGLVTAHPLEEVRVYVATPALIALQHHGEGTSTEYVVGQDTLGPMVSRERTGWNTLLATFELREQTTALDPCVYERRSRPPPKNRKVELEFRREDGRWR